MKLLEVKNLDKRFFCAQKHGVIHAVNNVSFNIEAGEFLGLVGESGCGKSTIAQMLMGLLPPDGGEIVLEERKLVPPFHKSVYQRMQLVFQLPGDSFDSRKTIGSCLTDMQRNFGVGKHEAQKRAAWLLERVGLGSEFLQRYPHQLSGGECQRAAIARAISVSPKLMICDEITSALDVSIQAQIVELLQDLRKELNLSALFISHDLALVQGLCDRILVMNEGTIVEEGTGEQLLRHPKDAYTKALFSAIFDIDAEPLLERPYNAATS